MEEKDAKCCFIKLSFSPSPKMEIASRKICNNSLSVDSYRISCRNTKRTKFRLFFVSLAVTNVILCSCFAIYGSIAGERMMYMLFYGNIADKSILSTEMPGAPV